MTRNDLRNRVREVSPYMTVSERDGEIRVTFLTTYLQDKLALSYGDAHVKAESLAYYTDMRGDALATARDMWARMNGSN